MLSQQRSNLGVEHFLDCPVSKQHGGVTGRVASGPCVGTASLCTLAATCSILILHLAFITCHCLFASFLLACTLVILGLGLGFLRRLVASRLLGSGLGCTLRLGRRLFRGRFGLPGRFLGLRVGLGFGLGCWLLSCSHVHITFILLTITIILSLILCLLAEVRVQLIPSVHYRRLQSKQFRWPHLCGT